MSGIKKEWRVGCVGAGYFAPFHIDAWDRIDGADLIALCDIDITKAVRLQDHRSWVDVYSDVETMLQTADLEILDIITPPATHFDLIHLAMKYDVHIICQKPLSPSIEESIAIAELVQDYSKQVIIHENFRWMPWYNEVGSLVKDNMIGQPHYLYHRMRMGDGWPPDAYLSRQPYFRTMPRLLVHETGVHFIDVFRSILGEVIEVYAKIDRLNPQIAGEDRCLILLEYDNGARAVYDACRYNESAADNPRYTFGQMLVEGRKGSISLNEDGDIQLQPLGLPMSQILYDHEDIAFGGDCVYHLQSHIIDSLGAGSQPMNTIDQYIATLRVVEAIYESAKKGIPISLSE